MRLRQRLFVWRFRARVMLFYPVILALFAYLHWVAPRFGADHVARVRQRFPRQLSAWFLRVNGIEVDWHGTEHLRTEDGRPRVLVCNHNSRFDAYILLASLPFAYKSFWSDTAHITSEGFRVLAAFGRACDLFFVHDKHSVRHTVAEFRRAEAFLRSGGTLSLFPEGTFSPDGQVRDFGLATLTLAVRTHATIVPVVMRNTRATFETRWQAGAGRPRVEVSILPPIATAGLHKTAAHRLKHELEQLMNQHLAMASRGQST